MGKGSGFLCTECGAGSGTWLGRCPACGTWGSLAPAPEAAGGVPARPAAEPVPLEEAGAASPPRIPVGPEGLDRVLGGGLVPGSVVLLAGEPGIGKSTLLLQMAGSLAASGEVVVATGEESAEQVALRARRLGISGRGVVLLPETSLEAVLERLGERRPLAVVVDSVQTMASGEVGSAPGSVAQVRVVAARLLEWAKRHQVPVVLVGHVTKEGAVAGPKLLEHLVDTVLSLEGEPGHELRVLRASKNRFGTVAETALFAMTGRGLEPVANPSAWLLEDRRAGSPGSAVAVTVQGTVPLLVEVQALAAPTALGTPRRVAQGVEPGRLALLLAVLERRAGLRLADRDVYVNVVGGIAPREPGVDLAVAAAVLSSLADRPLAADLAVFGEVGLLGEVRGVSRPVERAREARRLGFARLAVAARDAAAVGDGAVSLPTVAELERLLAGAG